MSIDEAVMEAIAEMASATGHQVDKAGIKVYMKHLRGYSLEAIQEAVYSASEGEAKFPSVATFKKKYLDKKKNLKIDAQAKTQARMVRSSFNSGKEPHYTDPITFEVMDFYLNFSEWSKKDEEEINKFWTMTFVRHYKEICDDEAAFKDAQKRLKESEQTQKVDPDDYITANMKYNRIWIDELNKTGGGEHIDSYHFHPWAVFEGSNCGGYIIDLDCPKAELKKKMLASKMFCERFPRIASMIRGDKVLADPIVWEAGKLASQEMIDDCKRQIAECIAEMKARYKKTNPRGRGWR